MTKPVKVSFELLDTTPEISLIQLLMDASKQFDSELSNEEKDRAINYFNCWHAQTSKAVS